MDTLLVPSREGRKKIGRMVGLKDSFRVCFCCWSVWWSVSLNCLPAVINLNPCPVHKQCPLILLTFYTSLMGDVNMNKYFNFTTSKVSIIPLRPLGTSIDLSRLQLFIPVQLPSLQPPQWWSIFPTTVKKSGVAAHLLPQAENPSCHAAPWLPYCLP